MYQKTSLRRWLPLACALLLCVIVAAPAEQAKAAPAAGSFLTVSVDSVALRSAASGTATVVKTLTRGANVQYLSYSGTYYKVAAGRGIVGYLPSSSVRASSSSLSAATKQDIALDWPSRYIDTSSQYSFAAGMEDMAAIDSYYPNTRIVTIGASVWKHPIKALVVGSPQASIKLLVHAGIHAREYMTSQVVMRQAQNMLEAAKRGAIYGSMPVTELLSKVEIWFVPFVNPDGILLVTEGLSAVPATAPLSGAKLRSLNDGSSDFSRWKSNGRGVDLNHNFDGNWQVFKDYPTPDSEGYSGPAPFSEPESQALRALTLQQDFDLSLSYHAQGEILYWSNPYNSTLEKYDYELGKQISLHSGYRLLGSSQQAPTGGYRDWINLRLAKPAFTIEIGNVSCPLPMSQFPRAWLKNRYIVLQMASALVTKKPPPPKLTLAAPTIKVASTAYDSIKLTWAEVSGAMEYEVYRAATSTGTYSKLASVSSPGYTDAGLTAGKSYYYKVRAKQVVGSKTTYSGYSSVVSAKPAPAAPVVKVASTTYGSVKLAWAAVAGAAKYEVYYATTSGGAYTKLSEVSSLSYAKNKLITGKDYYFKVRAYCLVGTTKIYGAYSAVVSAKPMPAKPVVQVASTTYNSVKLTWDLVGGATKYEVYRATASTGAYTKLAEVSSPSYTNTGLTTGKAYYYKVRAYRLVGSTKYYGSYNTALKAVPVPAAPTGLKAARAYSTSAKISWASVAGATKYEVYRAASKSGTYAKVTETASLDFINIKLVKGTTYYYKLRAYRLVNSTKIYGPYSAILTYTHT